MLSQHTRLICNRRLATQQGVVIVIALFVMSIVLATAVAMISRQQLDIRRTALLLKTTQANLYAEGAIAWAIDQLNNNLQQQQNNSIIDPTPIQSKIDKINGFTISSTIDDVQAYFNLNNIGLLDYSANFMRLLQTIAPHLETNEAEELTKAIVNWISPLSENSTYDTYYATLHPPYHASHRPMTSVSELQLVKGMTPALFEQLSPYMTALPPLPTALSLPTPLNINNAPLSLLVSLSETLTQETARAIVQTRQKSPFINVSKFLALNAETKSISTQKITTKSDYFLVKTRIITDQTSLIFYTLLFRTLKKSKPVTTVVWQTKGTL